jgi:hypothetical protein
MRIVFPPSSTWTFWKIPSGDEGQPYFARKVMEDATSLGDPSFFHNTLDMMHVDAPSSMIHRCTKTF